MKRCLLSAGPRTGLWMVGEFGGEEAKECEAGC